MYNKNKNNVYNRFEIHINLVLFLIYVIEKVVVLDNRIIHNVL